MVKTIQKTETICKIDHENEEVMVYKKTIIDLFSFVGEGISDFHTESFINRYYSGQKLKQEWHNGIILTFHEQAWGGISLTTWNAAEQLLENVENSKIGLEYYVINPSKNRIMMIFDSSFEMS